MQLARLFERLTWNFGEKILSGAVYFDVAKAFDTVWIGGLFCKLTLLKLPSYIVDAISSYLRGWTFVASFQMATPSRRGMRAGVAQGGLISSVFFNLYVDIPSPSHHVDLALYADDTVIVAASRNRTLLISYLESYLNDLQRWMSEWRFAINACKSSAIIFARAGLRFFRLRLVTLRGTNRMIRRNSLLGVTLDTRVTWSPHIDQVRKRTVQGMGMVGPLLNRKNDLSVRNGVLLYRVSQKEWTKLLESVP